MRTLLIIVAGLLLFGACVLGARGLLGAGPASLGVALKTFIPLWLLIAAANMWVGVARAGYSVTEELPIFCAIFGLPAAVAWFVWWKFS
ncbi:MAG TPA: hypothetical protein VF928_12970 [Usitatibacteraceae bacterium]